MVQLRADTDFDGGTVAGRIEHVSSGAAALFDSIEELIAWMRDAVRRGGPDSTSLGSAHTVVNGGPRNLRRGRT